MAHPRHQLNPHFNNPLRFSLMASLAGAESMTFQQAKDYLGTTDSTLSKHASALEKEGYVKIDKHFVGKKAQTKFSLSKEGLRAWNDHLAALKAIAEGP
ncbi:transcriptional regulator [Corynebacterium breve]|uniref:Transcriptional regulator n=1 Tax=Corynebacterium breve TaxID=3049799 RepID=A0ABY8VC44_9CORY|nr:transcriptional regulator [Corynebacterium breve]WIM67241.1 transcriptional regulator [Corynebacterium breve]